MSLLLKRIGDSCISFFYIFTHLVINSMKQNDSAANIFAQVVFKVVLVHDYKLIAFNPKYWITQALQATRLCPNNLFSFWKKNVGG